jgi:ribosome-binding factor A
MHSRPERVADQIRQEVTTLLARSVQDPGIGFVTITRVKVTADLQLARIFYTTIAPEADLAKAKKETAKALDRAKPFLRRQVTQRIQLRRSPELEFLYDDSIADLDNVERLLQEVREERRQYELANPEEAQAGDAGKAGEAGQAGKAGKAGSET